MTGRERAVLFVASLAFVGAYNREKISDWVNGRGSEAQVKTSGPEAGKEAIDRRIAEYQAIIDAPNSSDLQKKKAREGIASLRKRRTVGFEESMGNLGGDESSLISEDGRIAASEDRQALEAEKARILSGRVTNNGLQEVVRDFTPEEERRLSEIDRQLGTVKAEKSLGPAGVQSKVKPEYFQERELKVGRSTYLVIGEEGQYYIIAGQRASKFGDGSFNTIATDGTPITMVLKSTIKQ